MNRYAPWPFQYAKRRVRLSIAAQLLTSLRGCHIVFAAAIRA
jgi:hypothetical protein